jgi:hypothetical protein
MIFMEENPVRSLIENLGRELSQKSPSSQIFPYGKLQGKEITPANFVEITKTENPRRIAFVDGGDGVLEESPNFMIIVNRVYFCMFEGKKRISASKLKHRIEFFSYVVSEVKDNDDKKIVSYNTKLFPYSESDLSYLPAEEDLESKTENTGVLQESHLVSLSRRFAEWSLAEKVVSEELSEGDILVMDGSLQTGYKHESRYASKLYDAAQKKGVIVCGLTKTSRLLMTSGEPMLARIQEIAEDVTHGTWFVEVADMASSDNRGHMLAAKFHPQSKHIFRFEILQDQFSAMNDEEKNHILASLVANSGDIAMPGYPYGSIDADRFAQVRKNELEMYRGMMMAEMSKLVEWKRLQKYTLTTKFHDDLNWVTS